MKEKLQKLAQSQKQPYHPNIHGDNKASKSPGKAAAAKANNSTGMVAGSYVPPRHSSPTASTAAPTASASLGSSDNSNTKTNNSKSLTKQLFSAPLQDLPKPTLTNMQRLEEEINNAIDVRNYDKAFNAAIELRLVVYAMTHFPLY